MAYGSKGLGVGLAGRSHGQTGGSVVGLCVDSSEGRGVWVCVGVQEHVVEETAMMVPDTQQRLQNAVVDLAALLVRCHPPCGESRWRQVDDTQPDAQIGCTVSAKPWSDACVCGECCAGGRGGGGARGGLPGRAQGGTGGAGRVPGGTVMRLGE